MSPMVVETLKLGIAILNGGNAGVQQVIGAHGRWCRLPGYSHLTSVTLLGRGVDSAAEGATQNHLDWCLSFVANYIRVAGSTDKTRLGVDRQMCT